MSGFWGSFPDRSGGVPGSDGTKLADAAILVCRQNGRNPVCVYVDSRHAAAVPLRPVDGLCVEVPVPGGGFEFVSDRFHGGLVSIGRLVSIGSPGFNWV